MRSTSLIASLLCMALPVFAGNPAPFDDHQLAAKLVEVFGVTAPGGIFEGRLVDEKSGTVMEIECQVAIELDRAVRINVRRSGLDIGITARADEHTTKNGEYTYSVTPLISESATSLKLMSRTELRKRGPFFDDVSVRDSSIELSGEGALKNLKVRAIQSREFTFMWTTAETDTLTCTELAPL